MTDVWFEHRKVTSIVLRNVNDNQAVELEIVFPDGTNKTLWLLRGEY